MVDAINSWIKNGNNYAQGVSLYNQYGASAFWKGVFKRGETPANRIKLNAFLVELRDSQPIEIVKPVITKQPALSTPKPAVPIEKPAANPTPELLKVKLQRKQTYAEIQQLHPYLSLTAEGEDLRVLAQTIVRAGKMNTELWARYNFLTENPFDAGETTPEPPPPVMIDLRLVEKRESLRKSINKAENRIKGQEKPKQKTLDLIADRKLELKTLDEHIQSLKREGGI